MRELGEITPELVDLFSRLGLRTLGQLAALEAGDVLARFGTEGLHAHRLAGGSDTRSPAATDPPPEWWVEHPFLEPVEQLEAVVFVAKRLADELADDLAAEGRVCVRLVVIVETEYGERCERAWYRDQGFSAGAMVERVRWQLEGWAAQPDGPEREPVGELRPIVTGDSCGMKRSEATYPLNPQTPNRYVLVRVSSRRSRRGFRAAGRDDRGDGLSPRSDARARTAG